MKRFWLMWLLCLLNVSKPVIAQTPAPVVPDFTLFRLDGTPFSSKQMVANKPLVFSFFDVTCTHCQTTMKLLSSHYLDLRNAAVYLVTLDRKDAVLKFLNNYGPAFLNKDNVTILQDVQYEFIPKFQPVKYPSVFLYDKNRKLVIYEKDDKKMLSVLKKLKTLQ
ncbi:peroxiredoxin family protein [Desertivirga brevis]|uniref:peroxiredoxin family protein n=1 Tax=Desertivirga brevis TaxID=2810310 RepID=UPI001A978F5B|nr:redoxin domain-containing protein [Pedobacter sp. SYSU D00873]